jgi:hypothetical protein
MRTFQTDTYYRAYRFARTYDAHTNNLLSVDIYFGIEHLHTSPNLDDAKKVVDEWQNAR